QSDGAAPLHGNFELSFFQVTTTADSGPGSLRQAITDAGSGAAPAIITFSIPGSGAQVIMLAEALPPITVPTLIDGFSQPAYTGMTLIELRGQDASMTDDLAITEADVVVYGVAIDGYAFSGGLPSSLNIQSGPFPGPGRLDSGSNLDSYRINLTTDEWLI